MTRADELITARLHEDAAKPHLAQRRVQLHHGIDVRSVARALSRHGYRPGALRFDKGWSDSPGFIRPDGHEIEIASQGAASPLELRHWGPESTHDSGPERTLRSTAEAVRYLSRLHGTTQPPAAKDWRNEPDAKVRRHALGR